MPNGERMSREEWDMMEEPLNEASKLWEDFSSKLNFTVDINYHNWPNRRFKWVSQNNINCIVRIGASRKNRNTFSLGFSTHVDKEDGRYLYMETLEENLTPPLDAEKILPLLEKAYKLANDIEFSQLKKV